MGNFWYPDQIKTCSVDVLIKITRDYAVENPPLHIIVLRKQLVFPHLIIYVLVYPRVRVSWTKLAIQGSPWLKSQVGAVKFIDCQASPCPQIPHMLSDNGGGQDPLVYKNTH